MADTSAPVGTDAGAASAPDFGSVESDIGAINAKYDPQIEAQEKVSEGYESQAVAAQGKVADEAERQASDTSQSQEIQHWLTQVPTRQAAYTTNMHAAPILAILTALGGRVTKLNGQQMLAATTGIVQGINESSEQKYDSAMKAWQASFEAMKEHQRQLTMARNLMLQSYAGRADAYQKAAEAARRMTGDLLDDKQKQTTARIDLFKAQATAWSNIQRIDETHRMNDARIRDLLQKEARWKAIDTKAAKLDPGTKALIDAEHKQWQNADAHVRENDKRIGQLTNDLNTPADVKADRIKQLEDDSAFWKLEMDRRAENGEKLAAGAAAKPTPPTPQPGSAASGGAPHPMARPVAGAGAGGSGPPPQAIAKLKSQPGKPITFQNGQTWIVDATGGEPHLVQ
jgi:hypothetical protein